MIDKFTPKRYPLYTLIIIGMFNSGSLNHKDM